MAIDTIPSSIHWIVIQLDKTPTGEHVRIYNDPTVDEVTILIVVMSSNLEIIISIEETINGKRHRNAPLLRCSAISTHLLGWCQWIPFQCADDKSSDWCRN